MENNLNNKDGLTFNVQLEGNAEVQQQLEEFKRECDAHEKHRRKRCKRRYYNTGLMVHILRTTMPEELQLLLENGARTFYIDASTCFPNEVTHLIAMTKKEIATHQKRDTASILQCGIAYGIDGDSMRIGRLHNNCSVLLQKDDIISLTSDKIYQYGGFGDIAYMHNLDFYWKKIKVNDKLSIGKEIHCKVVKKLKNRIAVMVDGAGLLNSYDFVELPRQCSMLNLQMAEDAFKVQVQKCVDEGIDFIVVPKLRCVQYLRALRKYVEEVSTIAIIGSIDFEFVICEMVDLMGIIKLLDYLFIPNFFDELPNIQKYIYDDVIPITKCLKKPIIGTVPLEKCSDFKRFESHCFLWKIDTILIQKSTWCNKYPIIVKKLLPICDFRRGVVDNSMTLKSILSSFQSIVNFIIRTISSIECYAIFINCKCTTAATALARVEIYCPVFVMFALEQVTTTEQIESENCITRLARSCNLRRNLFTIIYKPEMNKHELKPIDYGICYARSNDILQTGDFIITIDICKEDEENIQYGIDPDVAILRAFYLPPQKIADKFKFA